MSGPRYYLEKDVEHLTAIKDYIFKIEENLAGHFDSDICMMIDGQLEKAKKTLEKFNESN